MCHSPLSEIRLSVIDTQRCIAKKYFLNNIIYRYVIIVNELILIEGRFY